MKQDKTKKQFNKWELLLYKNSDGKTEIKVRSEDGREFLNLHQIVDFFEKNKTYIVRYQYI